MQALQPSRPCKSATANTFSQHKYSAILTHDEACSRLQTLGFKHIDRVPESGKGRIPARGKGPNNTGTALCWTDDMQALHWREFTTEDYGTIFAKTVQAISGVEAAKRFRRAELKRRKVEADRQELQARAARKAQDTYRAGATNGQHEYITRKGLRDLHNARINRSTGALLIPCLLYTSPSPRD